VIHRDVKPANILVHDGQPVISDFGIALAVSAGGGGRLTETGLSLGTPHYMSPEQATGDGGVGPATDIYALGCVLYEMLVGEPPYTGSTPQAVLGKIITAEPVSATKARRSVPANVDAAVRKALEKLPADRFGSAGEFARALGDPWFRHGDTSAIRAVERRGLWNPLSVGASAAAVLAAAVAVWAMLDPAPPAPVERFALDIDVGSAPAVLPDGSGVVYAAEGQLVVRRWDALPSVPIPGTEGVNQASLNYAVSPDAMEIAFIVSGELRVAPLAGGVVRALTDSVSCCMAWGTDGFIYYSSPGGNINRVPAAGGAVEVVTRREVGAGLQSDFHVLPGGAIGLFSQWDFRGTTGRIEAIRMATGERRVLTPGLKPNVTSTGHLVFASPDGQILAAPFDAEALELSGPAVPVVDGVYISPTGSPHYSLAADGTLAYSRGTTGSNEVEFVWVSRSGEVTPVDEGERFVLPFGRPSLRLSRLVRPFGRPPHTLPPDGNRIAFSAEVDGNSDIWIKNLSGGAPFRLTFGDETDENPEWSLDGESIVHLSANGTPVTADDRAVWSRRVDGVGVAERLAPGASRGMWSPDGEWLVLYRGTLAGEGSGRRDILALRPEVDTAPSALIASDDLEELSPAISRDGRWLAYTSNETGRREVYVRPFPNVDEGVWQVSLNGGTQPVWAHNGRELFFYDGPARELKAVAFTTSGTAFSRVAIASLFAVGPQYQVDILGTFYDVARDDARFLMVRSYGSDEVEPASVVLVRNFFEELLARVPN
jgi:serine/threonine-protein kinase